MPRGRVRVHQRSRSCLVLRWTTLHEVGGEREGRASEADQRDIECSFEDPDRLEDVSDGLEWAESIDRRSIADGCSDHGPDPRLDIEFDPHRKQWNHDVGEQDRGIDSVTTNRLKRHLRGEVGALAQLEDRVSLPQLSVFGEAATCLSHEPDGDAIGRFPTARREEPTVGWEGSGVFHKS